MHCPSGNSRANKDDSRYWPVPDLQEYLMGHWRLERCVEDVLAEMSGEILGKAQWQAGEQGLRYHEKGQFKRPEQPAMACSQSYLYKLVAPAVVDVCFSDGRFFHQLDLRSGQWEADHLCGPDLYRGRFEVLSPDRWEMIWHVTGPRKNAVQSSRYLRLVRDI